MHSAALRFEDLVLRIRCAARADLAWLLEFLTPQFAPVRAGRPHWTITLRTATRTCADRAGRVGAAPAVRMVTFALDTQTLTASTIRSGPHRLTVLDEGYGVVYEIDAATREIDILRPARNRSARIALMRVARELAMNEAAARGGLLVHGGAFLLGRKAVILSGPKGSGKTTSLLQAMGHPAVRYVSNDRVLVAGRSRHLRCLGIPTIVTIRSGSLLSAPRMAVSLPRSGYVCDLTRREATRRRRHKPTLPDRAGRYSLSPAQLCDLMQTGAAPGGELSALLFPVIRPRKGGARLRALGERAARRRIGTGLFRAGLPPVRDAVFAAARRPRGRTPEEAARSLARRVACFELELGRDAMTDASWIDHLAALLAPTR
jgi:hypothetical protein